MHAGEHAQIQEIFRRENRSFLQYVSQSTPWSSPSDRKLVDTIDALAKEEQQALVSLAKWMDAHRIAIPYLGAFPTRFSNYNFIDIRKLLVPLIVEQKKELDDLRHGSEAVPEGPLKVQVNNLVALNEKHLAEMMSCATV